MSFITISRPNLIVQIIIITIVFVASTIARSPHVINFRSPNLYPESLTWDPTAQHFIVGSLSHPTLVSVSDAAVTETLIYDASLPLNSCIVGVFVDRSYHRLLAVVNHRHHLSNFLAAYDLRSRQRNFFTPLLDDSTSINANDVTVDFSGNAYVSNSAGNRIWKVTLDGEPSILSRSPVFTSHPVDHNVPYHSCGLNGVVYISKGYLLVVQSNTGKLYKVNVDDGTARTVILNKELTAADGMAVRSDGVVVVVSQYKVYFIKSDDNWSEGIVFDETDLEVERHASSVAIGGEDRVYVLYGHVNESVMGNVKREEFSIVEVRSEKESREECVWVYVLIGLALAYFLFWRFQMRQLVTNMNKKTA